MKHTFRKIALVCYTFVLMNWAAVAGLYYFTRGSQDIWNPAGGTHRLLEHPQPAGKT